MIETFEDHSQFVTTNDGANLATDTSTYNQGSASVSFDKTGGTQGFVNIWKRLATPWDVQAFHDMHGSPLMKMDVYHADFTGINSVRAILVYRYDTSPLPDVYDEYSLTSFTGGAWNTISVDLRNPTNAQGSATRAQRRKVIAIGVNVTVASAATTFANLKVDAMRIEGVNHAMIAFPGNGTNAAGRMVVPPFDTWLRNRDEAVIVNEAEAATETVYLTSKERVTFGYNNIRRVADEDSYLHGLEDSMRIFGIDAVRNQGFSVAYPANELMNTTLGAAASAGDLSITLSDTVEIAWLGDAAEIRIGPNNSRQVERLKIISRSGTTAYLDRPLAFAHENGTGVYSLGYYPNLAIRSKGHPLRETQQASSFSIEAVETF